MSDIHPVFFSVPTVLVRTYMDCKLLKLIDEIAEEEGLILGKSEPYFPDDHNEYCQCSTHCAEY